MLNHSSARKRIRVPRGTLRHISGSIKMTIKNDVNQKNLTLTRKEVERWLPPCSGEQTINDWSCAIQEGIIKHILLNDSFHITVIWKIMDELLSKLLVDEDYKLQNLHKIQISNYVDKMLSSWIEETLLEITNK